MSTDRRTSEQIVLNEDTHHAELPIPNKLTSPRRIYLNTIGLTLDPFATPVAEQELAFSSYSLLRPEKLDEETGHFTSSAFFDYFTSPPISRSQKYSLLTILHQPTPAFVYGTPGSGKTTLRLTLEAESRRTSDGTLIVSYILGDDLVGPITANKHWERLSQALAIDLFIQIVEQFSPLNSPPTAKQTDSLRSQLNIGGPALQRLANRVLYEPHIDPLLGLGQLWPAVGRSAVRYTARPKELQEIIRQALTYQGIAPQYPSLTGQATFTEGIHTAKQWGFNKIFILIDGVDMRERTIASMWNLLTPLVQILSEWQVHSIFGKFFIPLELHKQVESYLTHSGSDLHIKPFEFIIKWNEVSLRALVAARFRAAHSRRVGFDDLASPDLAGKLDKLILRAAHGSPRKLLSTISTLLNVHAARDPYDPTITFDDWERARTYLNNLSHDSSIKVTRS